MKKDPRFAWGGSAPDGDEENAAVARPGRKPTPEQMERRRREAVAACERLGRDAEAAWTLVDDAARAALRAGPVRRAPDR